MLLRGFIIMAHKPGLTKKELEQVLADSTFVADYRFSVHDCGDGECTIHVPFQEKYVRPGGLVCGPVFMAAADMAMWLAIMTKLGRVEMAVTAEMKTSFLNGAKREDIYCTARTLKLGRRLIFGVARCVNGDGTLLTHHSFTYIRPDM
jgi:uncharacterized protein (TIGR00369 family)